MMRKELIRLLGDGKAGELEQKNVVKQKQGGSFRGGAQMGESIKMGSRRAGAQNPQDKICTKEANSPPPPRFEFLCWETLIK